MPIFASGLGLLEPIKSVPPSQISKPKDNCKDVQVHENDQSLSPSKVSTIPDVSFDWHSSGLTNPLEENQLNCNIFDFDLLLSNSNSPNTSSSAPTKMSSNYFKISLI